MRKRKNQNTWLFLTLLVILVATLTLTVGLLCFGDNTEQSTEVYEEDIAEESAPETSAITEKKPTKIDFQPLVDSWVGTTSGNKSVLIYDLDRDEIAGEYNIREKYNTASLYKLFVVYEGYRRIENGDWQADEPAGTTGYTILECLDLAIRESYSSCAEVLHAKIGYDELENIVENDFDIKNTSVEGLISDTEDISKMMKLFYEHPDIKNETLITRIMDSFLNQPTTTYNWRQGLPSGFSERVNVYDKVGWNYIEEEKQWDVYHDAAIVEFPEEDRHFIVIVMTSRVPYQKIRELGTRIEETFYAN